MTNEEIKKMLQKAQDVAVDGLSHTGPELFGHIRQVSRVLAELKSRLNDCVLNGMKS